MKLYLTTAVAYFGAALLIVGLSRGEVFELLQNALVITVTLAPVFGQVVVGLIIVGIVLTALTRVQSLRTTVQAVLMAFVATFFFHCAFMLIKTSLPSIIPFYADPALASADRILHGGTDPWVFAHRVGELLPMNWVMPFYLQIWTCFAICLPVFIAATDGNAERVKRTLILYVTAWILIGNVMALGGMSVGPVYYDRLLGGEDFAALTEQLAHTDLGAIAGIQEYLWQIHLGEAPAIGAGISAFPSVHVSIAAVVMFYTFERSKILAPFAVAFMGIILFLSVYTGYHYALDGYVSIVVMAVVWGWLRRAKPASVMPAALDVPAQVQAA